LAAQSVPKQADRITIENRLYMMFHNSTGPNDFAVFEWVSERATWMAGREVNSAKARIN
jgi:hypothetical protein